MWWLLLMVCGVAWGETYEVGPGRGFESIGAVPWARLLPGDAQALAGIPGLSRWQVKEFGEDLLRAL